MDRKMSFLTAVLGADGASALVKAAERREDLGNALVPRTILAWIGIAARTQYEGSLPGVDNTYVTFKKSEAGYSGEITVVDDVYGFAGESLFHVASAVAIALGIDQDKAPTELRDLELARLGKSIDLLVKARVVTEDLLKKKILDPSLGYRFSHAHGTTGNSPSTTVHCNSPDGEVVGYATFQHNGSSLVPFGVYVDDGHHRRGIASHMYSYAQKATGKAVAPSKVQTPEGAALWQANAQQKQFGKTELPGQTAKPTAAAGPLEATPPTRQQGRPPASKKQKPKLPKVTRPQTSVPGLPKLPTLKLSEKQLQKKCPACAGSLMKGEKFVGCLCWVELAKNARLAKHDDGTFTLTFGKNWDRDALETFVKAVKVKP